MDKQQKVTALAAIPLFAQVGKKDLARLADCAVERTFPAGTEIVREGELGAVFFVIAKGKAEAVKGKGAREAKLADLGPGAHFGELALFENFPRNATIRAKTSVDCLAMTEWDFKAELRAEPTIALALLKSTMRRLRDADLEVARLKGERASGGVQH
jgi:CRP-like cAMP-binding protein